MNRSHARSYRRPRHRRRPARRARAPADRGHQCQRGRGRGRCPGASGAPLASSVLMTALPARVAGVPEVLLCSPPDLSGRVHDAILAAAAIAEVDEVYAIGGAQAIAAMAFGAGALRPVDLIVGPG